MARTPKFFYRCSLEGITFDQLCEMIPDHWRSGGSEEGWDRWFSLRAQQSLEVSYKPDGMITNIYWGR